MFYELPFYVTVPAYVVAPAFLDVQLPVFGSAVATVHSIRFTWNGVNLGCLTHNEEFEYQPKPESTHNTTQHDRYVLDLGIIMNTGKGQMCCHSQYAAMCRKWTDTGPVLAHCGIIHKV